LDAVLGDIEKLREFDELREANVALTARVAGAYTRPLFSST
jgi:hypothetical protein